MQRRTFLWALLGYMLMVGSVWSDRPVANSTRPAPLLNGGYTLSLNAVPQRTMTLNQAPTEIMLALGLADRLVGTAYLDDTVQVLSARYPSQEV